MMYPTSYRTIQIDGPSIFHRESVGLSLHYRESSRPSLGNTE